MPSLPGTATSFPQLWLKNHKLVADSLGRLVLCNFCPCVCTPRVIASMVMNGDDVYRNVWDLTPYMGNGVGTPGGRWRIREVGEAHYNDPTKRCTGNRYDQGTIDANGKLVGLPNRFVSRYSYDGYMELQQGCLDAYGNVFWPCS